MSKLKIVAVYSIYGVIESIILAIFAMGLSDYITVNKGLIFIVFVLWSAVGVYIYFSNNFQSIVLSRVRGKIYKFRLKSAASGLKIGRNVKILNPKKVSFGERCEILDGAVIAPLCYNNGKTYPSNITIGNNVHIGANDRIASAYEVTIEDDVLFAAFVHVTDHSHEYHDISKPIIDQGIMSKGRVLIKRGAWLAFGCHILSGVTVGEGAVVAANSVVVRDVPPYSVVAGNPAKVVKIYDRNKEEWISVKSSNHFVNN